MTNAQAEIANNRIQVLEDRIKSFNANLTLFPINDGGRIYTTIVTTITEFELEVHSLRKSLNTRREWLFNFVGGGWNQVHAYTLEEAIGTAKGEYSGLEIDEKSFRISTPTDYANLLSLFY